MMPQFVGGEDQERSVEPPVWRRQRSPVRGGRGRRSQAASTSDGRLGHFERIVNVDYLPLGAGKQGAMTARWFHRYPNGC